MKKFVRTLVIPLILILAMPAAGTLFLGKSLAPYLYFPPRPLIESHAPFSLGIFVVLLIVSTALISPFIIRGVRFSRRLKIKRGKSLPLPWWGAISGVALLFLWLLAWTRFPWFASFQAHTFFPLWLMFIVFVNALTMKTARTCTMTREPKRFFMLFIVSALFWWTFEFLNRFAANWYYNVPNYTKLNYCLLATLAFSTVLPAVASVQELLATRTLFRRGFSDFLKTGFAGSKTLATAFLILSCIGLFFIPIFPEHLFLLVWVAPFVVIISARSLSGEHTFLWETSRGEWNHVVSHALSALICGFFWEMWNYYSLSKWQYSIPFVHAVKIFEMPLLGYFGYFPFGLECAIIIELVLNQRKTL